MGSTYEDDRATLLASGYRDIDEFRGIKVGMRVRHAGQLYAEAMRDGTAVVLAVMRKQPSAWEATHGHPDVEIIARSDQPSDLVGPIRIWADYRTRLAETEVVR